MTGRAAYGASAVKRIRRTKEQISEFRTAVFDIAAEHQPCSGRQIYYRAVVAGLIEKDTAGSRKNEQQIGRALNDMREAFIDCDTIHRAADLDRLINALNLGDLDDRALYREIYRHLGIMPMWWISDDTRTRYRHGGYRDKDAALSEWHKQYRRDLWQTQKYRVEVWCESSSLGSVLLDVCNEYGVDMYPCRGQAGKRFLWDAARNYPDIGKPVLALYVGDFDPAGLDIGTSVEQRLRRYLPRGKDVDFRFRRIGITAEQVRDMQLPGHGLNPNISANQRRRFFEACDAYGIPREAVEAEAMAPTAMRQLLDEAIREHINPVQWELEQAVEASEKRGIWSMIGGAR